MKKIAALALGTLLATSAAPALAMDVPATDSYIAISPCFFDCLEGAFINATDASETDTFQINGIDGGPFGDVSGAAEYDAESGFAYFVTLVGDVFKFDVLNETGLEWLANNSSLPTVDGAIIGLALDDQTNTLYALYNDPDAGHYYVASIDQSSGAIGTPMEMPFVMTMVGPQEFAVSGGKFYVLTGVEQIKIFNVSDGELVGSIAYPMSDHPFFFGYAIDVSAGGVLRVASRNSDTNNDEFYSYDPETGSWSDAVVADGEYDGVAWFAAGSEPVTEELASTGVDATGIALAGAALVVAGAVVTVRRRARR